MRSVRQSIVKMLNSRCYPMCRNFPDPLHPAILPRRLGMHPFRHRLRDEGLLVGRQLVDELLCFFYCMLQLRANTFSRACNFFLFIKRRNRDIRISDERPLGSWHLRSISRCIHHIDERLTQEKFTKVFALHGSIRRNRQNFGRTLTASFWQGNFRKIRTQFAEQNRLIGIARYHRIDAFANIIGQYPARPRFNIFKANIRAVLIIVFIRRERTNIFYFFYRPRLRDLPDPRNPAVLHLPHRVRLRSFLSSHIRRARRESLQTKRGRRKTPAPAHLFTSNLSTTLDDPPLSQSSGARPPYSPRRASPAPCQSSAAECAS